jgi:hypothetical protein
MRLVSIGFVKFMTICSWPLWIAIHSDPKQPPRKELRLSNSTTATKMAVERINLGHIASRLGDQDAEWRHSRP